MTQEDLPLGKMRSSPKKNARGWNRTQDRHNLTKSSNSGSDFYSFHHQNWFGNERNICTVAFKSSWGTSTTTQPQQTTTATTAQTSMSDWNSFVRNQRSRSVDLINTLEIFDDEIFFVGEANWSFTLAYMRYTTARYWRTMSTIAPRTCPP